MAIQFAKKKKSKVKRDKFIKTIVKNKFIYYTCIKNKIQREVLIPIIIF